MLLALWLVLLLAQAELKLVKTASVSMIWLILVYLFHTMAELCIL
jgi:dipeptide/tripeptide permease